MDREALLVGPAHLTVKSRHMTVFRCATPVALDVGVTMQMRGLLFFGGWRAAVVTGPVGAAPFEAP